MSQPPRLPTTPLTPNTATPGGAGIPPTPTPAPTHPTTNPTPIVTPRPPGAQPSGRGRNAHPFTSPAPLGMRGASLASQMAAVGTSSGATRVSASSIQQSQEQLRRDLEARIARLIGESETRMNAKIKELSERVDGHIATCTTDHTDLKNAVDDIKGEISRVTGNVETLNAGMTTFEADVGGVLQDVDTIARHVDATSPQKPTAAKAHNMSDHEWNAVKSIARTSISHLYGEIGKNVPAYPSSAEEWPRLPGPNGTTTEALRFDLEHPASHARNAPGISRVVDYIKLRLPVGGPGNALHWTLARTVQPDDGALRVAACGYFDTLRRRYSKEKKAATQIGFPSATSTTAGSLIDVETGSVTVVEADNSSLRSKRKTFAHGVAKRRLLIPEYAGPEYAILDEHHAQLNEFEEDGQRYWFGMPWMSRECKRILKDIMGRTFADKSLLPSYRRDQLEGSRVLGPQWPKGMKKHRRVQAWMVDADWLDACEDDVGLHIVPVDRPTSYEDVQRLPWSADQAVGVVDKEIPLAALVGSKRRRAESSLSTTIEGTSPGTTLSSASRTRSASPEKRGLLHNDLNASLLTASQNAGYVHAESSRMAAQRLQFGTISPSPGSFMPLTLESVPQFGDEQFGDDQDPNSVDDDYAM